MELGNRQTLQELITFLKTLWSFTATAHHYVYTDEGIRHLLLDEIHLMGKERLVITAMHQLQHLIASALQRNMEVRHEGTTLCAIGNEIIITKIRFQTGDAKTLDTLHLVHRLHKIQESLMGSLTEITDVHTGDDNLLTSLSCSLLTLSHQRLDARITGISTGERNGTIGAVIVAAILYLQEIAGTVAAGT